VDAVGTLNLLEAIRLAGLEHHTRFYQARTGDALGARIASHGFLR
jgi:GDPmannose 4,6-dehydratase